MHKSRYTWDDDDGNLRPEVCEAFVLHFLGDDGTGTRFREMLEVFRVQVKEFALESMPRVNGKAWQRALDRALKD